MGGEEQCQCRSRQCSQPMGLRRREQRVLRSGMGLGPGSGDAQVSSGWPWTTSVGLYPTMNAILFGTASVSAVARMPYSKGGVTGWLTAPTPWSVGRGW